MFHVPTFLSQCRDLWALPPDRVVYEISTPFLAVYFVVITLGLYFMDSDEAAKHFSSREEVQSLCHMWYAAARAVSYLL